MKKAIIIFLILILIVFSGCAQNNEESQDISEVTSDPKISSSVSEESQSSELIDNSSDVSETENNKEDWLPLIGLPEYCVYVMDWTYDGGIISASNSGIPVYPYWSDKDRIVEDAPEQATIEYNSETFQYDYTVFDDTNYYHVDVYRSTSGVQILEIERESGYIISGGMSDDDSERPDKFPDKMFSLSSPSTPSYLRGGLSQKLETSLSPYAKDLTSDNLLSALQTTLENCFEGYTVHLWTEPNEDNPGICPECVLTPNQSIGILYPCELESEYRSFLYVIVVPSDLSPLFTLEELLESSARASGFYDKIEP